MTDFKQKLKIGAAETSLGDLIEFALDNSQSGSIEGIKQKRAIKAKLAEGEDLTTEEILLVKTSALQTLKDGATIKLLEVLAPNDLK
ncbi:MAG: hypothetical protein IPN69_08275 [Acidobacteria bacterium]|nr:hypothetical protein [Acidobacteriota bacterium]